LDVGAKSTMKISDIFKPRSVVATNESSGFVRAGASKDESEDASTGDEDRVSISPLSRQLSQISSILADDEGQRNARVAELKSQVQSGTYSVPSKEVAQAIVQYARDSQ
jgi:flagellar biosynthesis anti-sigma factor FlgM